jgi:predicted ArsR family transcriptional regulator
MLKGKNYRQLERIVRGFSNHRRIQILELLKEEPELSVIDVAQKLKINFKTVSEHMRRLAIAGLIIKRSSGPAVRHRLTERGRVVLKFLKNLKKNN